MNRAHMKLTVRNLQNGDFGNYRCISKNSLGETEGSIRLYGKNTLTYIKTYGSCCFNKDDKVVCCVLKIGYTNEPAATSTSLRQVILYRI